MGAWLRPGALSTGRRGPRSGRMRQNSPRCGRVCCIRLIGSYGPFRELLYRLRVKIANLCQTRAPCNGSYLGVFHHLEEKVTAKRNWKSSGAPTP